jgi:uncharacterized protein YecE (DUF72 family)
VELNAPFYRWPKPATVRRWKRDAPPGFIYTVKVNQLITHEKRMVRTKKEVQAYYEIADTLGEKMGCFLFQFPPSHRYTAARLKSIVAQLDPAQRNVVEFRHRSWWRDSVYRALAEHGISFCAVSAPRLPETFPPNQRLLYVRFSGKTQWYRHDYSREELSAWAERIQGSGAQEAWIYFNNDREGYAIKNALVLRRMLRAMTGAAPLPLGSRAADGEKKKSPFVIADTDGGGKVSQAAYLAAKKGKLDKDRNGSLSPAEISTAAGQKKAPKK